MEASVPLTHVPPLARVCVAQAPDSNPTVALLKQCCGGLFSTLVSRRLEIASAVITAGIDDDDPYEDTSKLQEHVRRRARVRSRC